MTVAARRVMGDCEIALNMLDMEEDERRWWVLWAGATALLRTVGYVLRNVDGEDEKVRLAIDAAWSRWKCDRANNAIFWEFIEKERNNILKKYEFSVLELAEVSLVVPGHDMPVTIGENLFRPLMDGFGTGEDARNIYGEALQWWDNELTRIEKELDEKQNDLAR